MDQDEIREAICKEIEDAFSDVTYPGDDRIVDPINNYERFKIADKLKGKDWKEIWPISVYDGMFNLFYLTPEGFHFYLPAYMIASLRDEDGAEFLEFVIGNLAPGETEADKEAFMEKARLFSPKQRAAIKSFVNYFYEGETHRQPRDERAKQFWDEY